MTYTVLSKCPRCGKHENDFIDRVILGVYNFMRLRCRNCRLVYMIDKEKVGE